jgi:putative addiction module CopG family antidote
VNSKKKYRLGSPIREALTHAVIPLTLVIMEVQFTADQEAFIHKAIADGRYQTPEDAVREAMELWEEQERSRLMLLAALDEAETDFDAGRFDEYDKDTLPLLADELKREARALRDLR